MIIKSSVLNDYSDDVSNLDIIGSIVWCHVRDVLIPRNKIIDVANACNLDLDLLPKKGNDADLFRRATSESSGKKDGCYTFLVRKVSDKNGVIIRHIIREERDENDKVLNYEKVGMLRFENGKILTQNNNGDDITESMINNAEDKFKLYQDHITGDEIHRMIKRVLDSFSRVAVHPTGGVYFIPNIYVSQLNHLQCFVKKIDQFSTGEGRANKNIFGIVPLPNISEQRETVATAFTSSFYKDVETAVVDMSKILKSTKGKPADNLVSAKVTELTNLKNKLQDYESIIGDELATQNFRLELLTDQVAQLSGMSNQKFNETKYGKKVIGRNISIVEKPSYTKLVYKNITIGRIKLNRGGVSLYANNVINDELKNRSECSVAGNGYKIISDNPDVLDLYLVDLIK